MNQSDLEPNFKVDFPIDCVAGTGNVNKLAELSELLADVLNLEPKPGHIGDCVEDGDTFRANALKKARHVSDITGSLSLADDSGLSVDALDGAPGIYSARFAGPDADDEQNRMKLLQVLEDVEEPNRSASFVCAFALVKGPWYLTVEGICSGTITREQRGSKGFGYDPIFVPGAGDGRTFAQMQADEKAEISHRAIACQRLIVALKKLADI